MWRFTPNFLAFLLTALSVGMGLTYYALGDGRFIGTYHWGSWTAWLEAGSPRPDPYTRAFVALGGDLQLGRGEGIQFIAQRDEAGNLLLRECNYKVKGDTPAAAFWTLRPSAPDGSSVSPEKGLQNVHSGRLARDNNGIATIYVGSRLAPENWLEISGKGYFELVLTFYNAPILAGLGGDISQLPVITKKGCS